MGKIAIVLVLASGLAAAELSEKFAKRLESADAAYQSAVQKADNVRFYALQKATQDRVKVLKSALTDATKAGDFDAAMEIKARLAAAESAGAKPKPKGVVKFGGHEYAMIEDKVPWTIAERQSADMGGHLATAGTPEEAAFLLRLAGGKTAWLGASDDATEGQWKWIDGTQVKVPMELNNENGLDHWMAIYLGQFHDGSAGHRYSFICEWTD